MLFRSNFNINVNAKERIERERIHTKVNTVINNAIPTLSGSSDMIKKNLLENYQKAFSTTINENQNYQIIGGSNTNFSDNNQNETFNMTMEQYSNGQSIPALMMRGMGYDGVSPANGSYTVTTPLVKSIDSRSNINFQTNNNYMS